MNLSETFEPPLSPAPIGGLRLRDEHVSAPAAPPAAPAPGVDLPPSHPAPAAAAPPLPNLLLRTGLVTLPQLTSALQQQAETGEPLQDVLVELGLVSAEDLAKLLDEGSPPLEPQRHEQAEPPEQPALPDPPPLVAVPAPQTEPTPDAPLPPAARFAVVAQLEGGSRVELGVYADLPSAGHVATQAMRGVRDALSDWPLLGGRYVRPSSVVSIEVTALL